MAIGGGGCCRMAGTVMTIAIILTLFSVSFENDFGGGRRDRTVPAMDGALIHHGESSGLQGLAHAMPVGQASEQSWEDEQAEENDASQLERESDNSQPAEYSDGSEGEQVSESANDSLKKSESTIPGQSGAEELLAETLEKEASTGEREVKQESSEHVGHEALSDSEKTEVEITSEKASTNIASSESEKEDSNVSDESERRSRAKTFLVVFMGHSGSTAFTTELRTHTEFEVELLEPVDHDEYERNTDLALKRARELMDNGIAKGKIPGFKIRPFHIQNNREAWRDFVKEYDTRIIWQYRENIIKQAIGEYRSKFLNDSSVIEGLHRNQKPCQSNEQKCSFRIDNMRGLHILLNSFTKSDELLADAVRSLRRDEHMMIVRYEDYLYRRSWTMKETFDFLGVEYQDTAPQRLKASPDNLCEMVINFQDVCDHFLPCQLWRPYLYDDVNNCRCKPGGWETFDATYCKREAWHQGEL